MQNEASTSHREIRFKNELISIFSNFPDIQKDLSGARIDVVLDTYLSYARRFIPVRPRTVHYMPDFWMNARAFTLRNEILEIANAIQEGKDLTRYVSYRAHTELRAPLRKPAHMWENRDFALMAYGAHHLHLSRTRERKKYGDDLLFVKFWRDEACLMFVGGHKSFMSGELQKYAAKLNALSGLELKGILPPRELYTDKETTELALRGYSTCHVVDGSVVLGAMLAMDGSDLLFRRYADHIIYAIREIDAKLDDPLQYGDLYGEYAHVLGAHVDFEFTMDHIDLCLFEKNSKALLRILYAPF